MFNTLIRKHFDQLLDDTSAPPKPIFTDHVTKALDRVLSILRRIAQGEAMGITGEYAVQIFKQYRTEAMASHEIYCRGNKAEIEADILSLNEYPIKSEEKEAGVRLILCLRTLGSPPIADALLIIEVWMKKLQTNELVSALLNQIIAINLKLDDRMARAFIRQITGT